MVIGIDIGGSSIRGILWNGKKIVRSLSFKIPKKLDIFEIKIKKMVEILVGKNKIFKIGIGTAGRVDGTKVVRARNIPYFNNFDFKTLLSNLQLPISNLKIDNDARTYALAEYSLGAGKKFNSMLMITLGTGIGRAFVKNGEVLKIRRFEYAEDWEKDYQKIHNKNKLADFLGEKLGLLIDALSPEIVVLGGGVVDKKGYFEAINLALRGKGQGARVKKSKLSKFAGAIGAALLWK